MSGIFLEGIFQPTSPSIVETFHVSVAAFRRDVHGSLIWTFWMASGTHWFLRELRGTRRGYYNDIMRNHPLSPTTNPDNAARSDYYQPSQSDLSSKGPSDTALQSMQPCYQILFCLVLDLCVKHDDIQSSCNSCGITQALFQQSHVLVRLCREALALKGKAHRRCAVKAWTPPAFEL